LKVGERIIKLRKELKLTQGELAKKLGIPQTTLSNYETGSRELGNEMLVKIADFFSVSIDYLFGLTECKQNVSTYNDVFIKNDNAIITNGKILENLNTLTPDKKDVIYKMINIIS